MPSEIKCPVCELSATEGSTNTRTHNISCPRCGYYQCTVETVHDLGSLSDPKRPLVSCWILDQAAQGSRIRLTPENLNYASQMPELPFFEKAKRLLIWMANKNPIFGFEFQLDAASAAGAVIQSFSNPDLNFVATYMAEQNWVKIISQTFLAQLHQFRLPETDGNRSTNGRIRIGIRTRVSSRCGSIQAWMRFGGAVSKKEYARPSMTRNESTVRNIPIKSATKLSLRFVNRVSSLLILLANAAESTSKRGSLWGSAFQFFGPAKK